jgi:hypothetical protein
VRKLFAIFWALIIGGLSITLMSLVPESVEAIRIAN